MDTWDAWKPLPFHIDRMYKLHFFLWLLYILDLTSDPSYLFTDIMATEKCINFPDHTKPIGYLDMGIHLQVAETFHTIW